MVPPSILILTDTRRVLGGVVQVLKAGDVVRAVDYSDAEYRATCAELIDAGVAQSLAIMPTPLAEAIADVENMRLRGAAVDEGAYAVRLYQGALSHGIGP